MTASPEGGAKSLSFRSAAQQSLRPELYARIAEKLVFNRLTYDVQMEIARLGIARELAFRREKGFNLSADESVTSFIMQRGFHARLGARPLRRRD
jgi:ATP-dependent Clp protease ATP-binding subunit ClpA